MVKCLKDTGFRWPKKPPSAVRLSSIQDKDIAMENNNDTTKPDKLKVREKELKTLEKDFDFERLELNLKLPNIFRILKISKAEIRHSYFLAWLLNPNESHNLRDTFLKHFLLDISVDFDKLNFQDFEIRREWKNIDLLIITSGFVVCIENKVESQEHSNQLLRYKEIIKESFPKHRQYFVYLTTDGDKPSEVEYQKYTYSQIVETLTHALQLYERMLTSEVKQYIQDYIEILKIEIMKEHELNDLALKIYNNHKEALDFIFENKPDLATEFYRFFEKKVKDKGWLIGSPNKGYVRFLTKPLKDILPKLKGWRQMESFSFETDYFWYNQKQVLFATVIAPGTGSDEDNQVVNLLDESLNTLNSHNDWKKPQGKKWLVHFRKRWKFDLEEMSEKNDNEIYEAIDKFWHVIESIVSLTEAAILKRKDQFIELKQKQEAWEN